MRMLMAVVMAVSAGSIALALAQDSKPSGPVCPTIDLGIEGTVQAVERA